MATKPIRIRVPLAYSPALMNLDAVKDTLARGDHIEIRGFGTFKVRHRKARTARNPRTGEPVKVAPRVAPVFKPSGHFRSRVDRGSGVSEG